MDISFFTLEVYIYNLLMIPYALCTASHRMYIGSSYANWSTKCHNPFISGNETQIDPWPHSSSKAHDKIHVNREETMQRAINSTDYARRR